MEEAPRAQLIEAAARVIRWYNSGERLVGHALVLAGNPGCGKTHIASAVHHAAGLSAGVMISEPDFIEGIKAGYNGGDGGRGLVSRCRRAKLLIFDDMGVSHVREMAWIQELYWRLLDGRLENKRATLVTTNLKGDEFKARLGSRALDRLMGATAKDGFVSLFGVPSYRQKGW